MRVITINGPTVENVLDVTQFLEFWTHNISDQRQPLGMFKSRTAVYRRGFSPALHDNQAKKSIHHEVLVYTSVPAICLVTISLTATTTLSGLRVSQTDDQAPK